MDRYHEFILTGQLPHIQEEVEELQEKRGIKVCTCGKEYPQSSQKCPECGKKNSMPHAVTEEYHFDPAFSNDSEHNEYLTYPTKGADTKQTPKAAAVEVSHYGKQAEDYSYDPKYSNETRFEDDVGFQKFYAEQLQKECVSCGDMAHKPEEDEKKMKEDFDEPSNGIESRPGHTPYNVPELDNDTQYGEDEREFGRTFPVGDKNSPAPVDTEGYGYEGESQEGFEPSFDVGAEKGTPFQHDSANLGYDPYDPSKFDRSDDWDGKGRDASLPTYTFQSEGKKININKLIEKSLQRGYSKQQIKELIKTIMGKKKASKK